MAWTTENKQEFQNNDVGPPFGPVVLARLLVLRDRLRDDKLESLVKTSGGKGLHVVVPLIPRAGWEEAKAYCREVAEAMARDNPLVWSSSRTRV